MKKATFATALAVGFAATAAAAAAALLRYNRNCRRQLPTPVTKSIAPLVEETETGRLVTIEKFSHYVARQIGFDDPKDCPHLCKFALDYLRKIVDCEEKVFKFFSSEADASDISLKMVEELDRCIMSYFAFHWSHAPRIVTQILEVESTQRPSKLRGFIMIATRHLRIEKAVKRLKAATVFKTLLDEMKSIRNIPPDGESSCSPDNSPVPQNERRPVLLLVGGGMGGGKSTILNDIKKETFWSGSASQVVTVEADAFKEKDMIFRELTSSGNHDDMLASSELVHKSSTDAASSLLVTALNEGMDVIMDGTLSWEPFVLETIAMARDVHRRRYRMGVGYSASDDGTVIEEYWEPMEGEEVKPNRKPYRIELVGVVCDAYLAVVRGIRRAIVDRRAVRVENQLNSHKRFAKSLPLYCSLVDSARIYCTDAAGVPPKLVGWKSRGQELLIESDTMKCLAMLKGLNEKAESVYELYPEAEDGDIGGWSWGDAISPTKREGPQRELRIRIEQIEQSVARRTNSDLMDL